MDALYVFLIRNDVWIYFLSVLGFVWYSVELIRAQRILRSAIFGLERERGAAMRNNALAFMGLFAGIIAVVFFVNSRIAPTLPAGLLRPPTPTPNPLSTPLSRPTDIGGAAPTRLVVTPNLAATVTLPGAPPAGGENGGPPQEATATATPYVPPTPFIDCTQDLNLTEPRDGAAVSGTVTFFGTADIEPFAYFVLETNGPQTNGAWASLLGRQVDTPVREGPIGSADLSNWQPGPYLIRLTVHDEADNVIGACVVQVTLTGP